MKKPSDPLLDYLRRPTRRRLQAVVHEHYEFVWHVAYRVLGNAEDAADVSQDVFLRLLLRPPEVDAVVSPKGYLSWCVVGRASTLRRSAERRRDRERASLERLSRSGLETDDLDALRAALEALPLELRQVVELRALPLDSSGRYSAVSLRPGTYRLELMNQGGREATFSLKMALAGQQPLKPGKLLGETEVRAGETARLDAAVR